MKKVATKWKERAKEDRANREQIKKNQIKILEDMTRKEKSIKLLRDLADLQNDAPLESYREEWEATMIEVYDFLNEVENSDSWIKIENEDDLPKETGEYWVKFGSEIIHTYFEVGYKRFSQNGRDFHRGMPTHYQPITKPNPPII